MCMFHTSLRDLRTQGYKENKYKFASKTRTTLIN